MKKGLYRKRLDLLTLVGKPAHPKPLPPLEEPRCPEHGTDRIRQAKQGHHYCATKLPDGSWCDWSDRR